MPMGEREGDRVHVVSRSGLPVFSFFFVLIFFLLMLPTISVVPVSKILYSVYIFKIVC